MSAQQWAARRSLGAGLVSVGTVLLLVAGMLVVFETPGGAPALAAPPGVDCTSSYDDGAWKVQFNVDTEPPTTSTVETEGGISSGDVTHSITSPSPLYSVINSTGPFAFDPPGYYWNYSYTGSGFTLAAVFIKVGEGQNQGQGGLIVTGANPGSIKIPHATSHVTLCFVQPDPTLTLTKTVIGGTNTVGDFTLTVTGPSPSSDATNVTSGVATTFLPGSYVVSETGPGGYTAGDWGGDCAADGSITMVAGQSYSCSITNTSTEAVLTLTKTVDGPASVDDFTFTVTPGDIDLTPGVPTKFAPGTYQLSESGPAGYTASAWGGDCAADGSITMVAGGTYSCTITNTVIKPTLTLTKRVVGGTAVVGDFTLTVTGPSPSSDTTNVTSGVATEFDPGSYVMSESGPAGYIASDWGGDCAADGSLTMVAGGAYSCTITNSAKPTLTLTKAVIGGDATPADFTLTVTGPSPSSDTTNVTSGVPTEFDPGSYVMSESGPSGYVPGDWGGDCATDGSLTMVAGQTYECTIANVLEEEEGQTLTLIKRVVGGNDLPDDFNLIVTGPDPSPATTPMPSGTPVNLEPGTYTASETVLSGYLAGDWGGDCSAAGVVTLAEGDHKVCTITNTKQPTLTLLKVWDPELDGDPPLGFSLQVAPTNGGASIPMTSGVAVILSPGAWTVSETLPAGFTAGPWGGDCDEDGNVVLAAGDAKTCSITNHEIPTLTLIKIVINGDEEPDDFELRVTGPSPSDTVTPMLSGVAVELEPGAYVASEADLVGPLAKYESRGWTGDCESDGSVTLAYGDHKVCTIINIDPRPKLTLIKIVIGGTASPNDFNLAVVTDPGGVVTAVLSGVKNDFDPGDYIATEVNLPGYAPGTWSGDCDPDGSVTLEAVPPELPLIIDDLTCTITNVATTTTTTPGRTTTTGGFETTTTDPGGTTTTTLVLGPDLPDTGAGHLFPILLGGLGLLLLGAGFVLLAPRQRPQWVM